MQTIGSDGKTTPVLCAITTELISNSDTALRPIFSRAIGSSLSQ